MPGTSGSGGASACQRGKFNPCELGGALSQLHMNSWELSGIWGGGRLLVYPNGFLTTVGCVGSNARSGSSDVGQKFPGHRGWVVRMFW